MTSQLIELINEALNTIDNDQRKQAEGKLLGNLACNPSNFFLNLGEIFGDSEMPVNTRQSAGTVASRLLGMKSKNDHYYWDEVNVDSQNRVKNRAFEALVSQLSQVMKTGAIIIAEIATIQLPRGEWKGLVNILVENCQHKHLKIKVASITTIGFICQKIKITNRTISQLFSEDILTTIIMGTRQQETILQQKSLKALEDSLKFLSKMMHEAKYRDVVFEVFLSNFRQQKHLELTYMALFEFMKCSYQYLGQYQETLVQLTEVHLDMKNQNQISILNLQMWDIIGQEYAQKIQRDKQTIDSQEENQSNFMQLNSKRLLLLFMNCLVCNNVDEVEDEAMKLAATRVIECFVKICDRTVLDLIVQSVVMLLKSDDPNHQQASVLLFSTICEYADRQISLQMFSFGFEQFFDLISSRNKKVVKNTLIGFVRLSESLPEVFLSQPRIKQIISVVMNFVRVDIKDVRSASIQILSNISQGLKPQYCAISDDPTILLSDVVYYFSENMIKLHQEHPYINERLVSIIINVLIHTKNRDITAQSMDFMISKYYEIANMKFQDSEFLVEQIVSIIHIAILAHKDTLHDTVLLDKICLLIDFHIKRYGIQAEGLNLLGAAVTVFGESFIPRASAYWNHIIYGLNSVNCMSTFKAALLCIGDFSRTMKSSFYLQADEVMRRLFEYIDSNVTTEVKLCIMNCMGDLVLSLQGYADTFIDSLIVMFDCCFKLIYEEMYQEGDRDLLQDLKDSLIETYYCVVFTTNGNQINPKLMAHFQKLATFVVRTCDQTLHPTLTYLKSSLQLVYDSAEFYLNIPDYQKQVLQVIESNQIKQLVRVLNKFSNVPHIKVLLDFIKQKSRF